MNVHNKLHDGEAKGRRGISLWIKASDELNEHLPDYFLQATEVQKDGGHVEFHFHLDLLISELQWIYKLTRRKVAV